MTIGPRSVRKQLRNGWQPIKEHQNPSTDQFGRQKVFWAAAKTPSRPKYIDNYLVANNWQPSENHFTSTDNQLLWEIVERMATGLHLCVTVALKALFNNVFT